MENSVFFLDSGNSVGLAAFGATASLKCHENCLDQIKQFVTTHKGSYIFLALSYDLKNEIHGLESRNHDDVQFPRAVLIVPETVVSLTPEGFEVKTGKLTDVHREYLAKLMSTSVSEPIPLLMKPKISRESYMKNVEKLQKHIQRGDIYEVNYCQEFSQKNYLLSNPEAFYSKFRHITQTPFSAYLELEDHIVCSGSPERFLKKVGNHLISQPIKGTIRRGKDEMEDAQLKTQLKNDPKERSENIMIVDLVRNDLSIIAERASVHVEELCEIYSFKTVHQMISTVSCDLASDCTFTKILEATFPMGSMTGAPKRSAMTLIEAHENFQRGLYSGSIGYIDPKGDFDLNVVIRSFLYNKKTHYLSCAVGSAITIKALPENEYAECLTKVETIFRQMNERIA